MLRKFISIFCLLSVLSPAAFAAEKDNAAYDRVMKTGTLRCGYIPYPPVLIRDPNTGEMSGLAVDVTNAVAKNLSLKVEWTAEFGFATSISDLQSGRFDVACTAFLRLPLEAKHLTYTVPFFYSQASVFVREGDMRFDKDISLISDPAVRIISADGQMASAVARTDFPKAQLIELSTMVPISQLIEDLAAGKADVFISINGVAEQYALKNPHKIRKVLMPSPLRVYQNTFAMNMGEQKLKTMLDSSLIDVIENGEMDRILKKYDPEAVMFKNVAKGYQP